MMTRDEPDRIIKDCTDMIEHLKGRINLQPELIMVNFRILDTLYRRGFLTAPHRRS